MSPHGLDATFYDDHAFAPDPADPVDRWCQLPQSGNRAAVGALLDALGLGLDGRLLVDPFCGAGSTLLAGAASGRLVVGCDVEPGAAAVSALKLAAPTLADELVAHGGDGVPTTPAWAWAAQVCALADGLGLDTETTLARVVADCASLQTSWDPAAHAVVCASAEHLLKVLDRGSLGGATVDVFTSPPHGTGRPSPWRGDGLDVLAAAPPPYDRSVLSADGPVTRQPDAHEALAHLLGRLQERGRLGRVAVEFESSRDRPDAGAAMAERLGAAGLRAIEVVTLYEGAADTLGGVVGGGVVVAHG